MVETADVQRETGLGSPHTVLILTDNLCSTFQVVETADVHRETGLGSPHTSHCLASGEIMISCVGDAAGNGGKSE